jgi:arylsulfatase A-like enzyme
VAGAPQPELIRGQTLLPVLQGQEPAGLPVFSECPARRSSYDDKALRVGPFKLVYNVKLDRAELYDLQADPGEQNDLSAAQPQRTATMRDQVRAWTADSLETWASLPQAGGQTGEIDAALENALRQIGY